MRTIGASLLLIAALLGSASAQTYPGGSSSLLSGTTPVTCTSGTTGILYEKSGAVQCDSTFTYDGSAVVQFPAPATLATTNNMSIRAGSAGAFGVINLTPGQAAGWQIQNNPSNLIVTTDNVSDIGTSGGNRPKNLWLSANASIPGTITNAGIASDATHTDATVCEDTTTHLYLFGSGTGGICLGTSGRQFKRDIRDVTDVGLADIIALAPKRYYNRDGIGLDSTREQVGLIADEVQLHLPSCANENTVDYLCVSVMSLNAIKTLAAEVEALKSLGR